MLGLPKVTECSRQLPKKANYAKFILDNAEKKPPVDMTRDIFFMVSENIKEERTHEDLLFQVMLDRGIPLSSKIEETVIVGR